MAAVPGSLASLRLAAGIDAQYAVRQVSAGFAAAAVRLLEASAAPSAPESANQSGPVAAVADSQTQRPPFPEQRDQSRDLPCGIQKADPCPQRFSVPFAPCQTTPRWRSTPVRQSARQGGPSLSLRAAAPSHNLAGLSQQQPGPVTHSYLTTTSGASVTRYREVVAECDQLTSLVRLWSPNKEHLRASHLCVTSLRAAQLWANQQHKGLSQGAARRIVVQMQTLIANSIQVDDCTLQDLEALVESWRWTRLIPQQPLIDSIVHKLRVKPPTTTTIPTTNPSPTTQAIFQADSDAAAMLPLSGSALAGQGAAVLPSTQGLTRASAHSVCVVAPGGKLRSATLDSLAIFLSALRSLNALDDQLIETFATLAERRCMGEGGSIRSIAIITRHLYELGWGADIFKPADSNVDRRDRPREQEVYKALAKAAIPRVSAETAEDTCAAVYYLAQANSADMELLSAVADLAMTDPTPFLRYTMRLTAAFALSHFPHQGVIDMVTRQQAMSWMAHCESLDRFRQRTKGLERRVAEQPTVAHRRRAQAAAALEEQFLEPPRELNTVDCATIATAALAWPPNPILTDTVATAAAHQLHYKRRYLELRLGSKPIRTTQSSKSRSQAASPRGPLFGQRVSLKDKRAIWGPDCVVPVDQMAGAVAGAVDWQAVWASEDAPGKAHNITAIETADTAETETLGSHAQLMINSSDEGVGEVVVAGETQHGQLGRRRRAEESRVVGDSPLEAATLVRSLAQLAHFARPWTPERTESATTGRVFFLGRGSGPIAVPKQLFRRTFIEDAATVLVLLSHHGLSTPASQLCVSMFLSGLVRHGNAPEVAFLLAQQLSECVLRRIGEQASGLAPDNPTITAALVHTWYNLVQFEAHFVDQRAACAERQEASLGERAGFKALSQVWLDNKDTATLKTAFNQHGRREWLLQKLYWLDAHQVCDLLSCWAMLGLLGAPHMRHVVIGALDKLRTGRVTTENSTWGSRFLRFNSDPSPDESEIQKARLLLTLPTHALLHPEARGLRRGYLRTWAGGPRGDPAAVTLTQQDLANLHRALISAAMQDSRFAGMFPYLAKSDKCREAWIDAEAVFVAPKHVRSALHKELQRIGLPVLDPEREDMLYDCPVQVTTLVWHNDHLVSIDILDFPNVDITGMPVGPAAFRTRVLTARRIAHAVIPRWQWDAAGAGGGGGGRGRDRRVGRAAPWLEPSGSVAGDGEESEGSVDVWSQASLIERALRDAVRPKKLSLRERPPSNVE